MDAAVPGAQEKQNNADNKAGPAHSPEDAASTARLQAFCDGAGSRRARRMVVEYSDQPDDVVDQPGREAQEQARASAGAAPSPSLPDDPQRANPGCWPQSSRRCAPASPVGSNTAARLAGGEERWLEVSATAIFQDGEPVQLLGMCRDVTERLSVYRGVPRARPPAGNTGAAGRAGAD